MSSRHYTASTAQHTIFRTDAKPLRFTGVLLGARTILDEDECDYDTRVRLFKTDGGSLVWAWDRIEAGNDDPEPDEIQRADALVISAAERSPAEIAAEAWDRRPMFNARLADASIRAWHEAALADNAIAEVLFIDVE
jgi:hypothetical protein